MIRAAKLGEGIEKVVVAGHAGGRYETAHGECVDQRVEEVLVLVGVRSGNFAVSAARIARLDERK